MPGDLPPTLAPGRIGAAAIAFFALAATTPILVLTTVVPAAYARGGGPLVPLTFAAVTVVLLLVAGAYAAMANRAPYAGAMFSYVSHGLGRPAGVAAGWLALAGYVALQLGLYGLAGLAAAPLLRAWFSIDAAWWAVAGVCWLVVALLGPIRAEVASGLLALLVLAELAVVAGFATANVIDPAGNVAAGSIVPAHPGSIDRPALGLLLAVAALAFAGFETAGTYAEEAMRPRREPGRAAYVAIGLLGVILTFAAWSVSVGAGTGQVTALARTRGPELVFDLAAARLAPWAVTLGRVLLLAGLIAAMLALHNAINRYLFAMAREGVLPAALARTSRRTSMPRTASALQSAVVLALLGAAYAAGITDPIAPAHRLGVVGGLAVLVALLMTAFAPLLHLNRVPNGEGAGRRFLVPIAATVGLGTLGYLTCVNLPELLDVPPGSRLVWITPAFLGALALAGALWGVVPRGPRPGIDPGDEDEPEVPRQREPGAHRPERIHR